MTEKIDENFPVGLLVDGKFPIMDFMNGAIVGYYTKIKHPWSVLDNYTVQDLNMDDLIFPQSRNSYRIGDRSGFIPLTGENCPIIKTETLPLNFIEQE